MITLNDLFEKKQRILLENVKVKVRVFEKDELEFFVAYLEDYDITVEISKLVLLNWINENHQDDSHYSFYLERSYGEHFNYYIYEPLQLDSKFIDTNIGILNATLSEVGYDIHYLNNNEKLLLLLTIFPCFESNLNITIISDIKFEIPEKDFFKEGSTLTFVDSFSDVDKDAWTIPLYLIKSKITLTNNHSIERFQKRVSGHLSNYKIKHLDRATKYSSGDDFLFISRYTAFFIKLFQVNHFKLNEFTTKTIDFLKKLYDINDNSTYEEFYEQSIPEYIEVLKQINLEDKKTSIQK